MSVQDFFKGKQILITGGSGYIGKALIEKLLRSCDGIEKIYVLLRKKKGKTFEERLKLITENRLFDTLKKWKPHYLKKLVPISGDVAEINLGLSEEDRKTIIENVNIIYHSAASVRFDDFLKDAVLLNVRGTREVAELALEVKNLVVFLHVSTTYCNTDKQVVDEIIYPPHVEWKEAIDIAEKLDRHSLSILSSKYIDPFPNTYTFAKSLAEHVVEDLCKGEIPTIILRPSVVVPTCVDPFVGWVDNLNGPVGLLCAGGKGILKISYGDLEKGQNFIPVDITVNMMLLATQKRAENRDLNQILVYNACGEDTAVVTNKDIINLGSRLTWDSPVEKLFWYPSFAMTNNWYLYYIKFLLYHMVPALMIDLLLRLIGKRPILVKVQRRIYIANMALIYFLQNQWQFINKNALALTHDLMECDRQKFSFCYYLNVSKQELYTFFLKGKTVAMEMLFKEDLSCRKAAWRNTVIMWLLDYMLHFIIYGVIFWILVIKMDVYSTLLLKLNSILVYWDNL